MKSSVSGPGRPHDASTHQRIIDATLEIIGQHGMQAVNFERVATKARTTRPTLYRRWASKDELIAEALESKRPHFVVPDTGSLKADLLETIDAFIANYNTPVGKQAAIEILKLRSLGSAASKTWTTRYGAPRESEFRTIFTRAITRGELPADADITTMMFVLSSCLLQLCLLSGESEPRDIRAQAGKVLKLVLAA